MFSKLYDTDGYDQVTVRARNIEDVETVKAAIENRFNRREEVVAVMAMNRILGGANEFFGYISKFLRGTGAMSLVVAGVSILNVMLMSTMERTKEIEIMKAIGASRNEIMTMFLLETVILVVFGELYRAWKASRLKPLDALRYE